MIKNIKKGYRSGIWCLVGVADVVVVSISKLRLPKILRDVYYLWFHSRRQTQ